MNMLVAIDEVTIQDHSYLLATDRCYYFMEYYAGKGFEYSDENSLVMNLKKPMKYKGAAHWKYKGRAINRIAEIVKVGLVDALKNISDCTFVPIPPSKRKDHEHYDDRVAQILKIATAGKDVDVRELLSCSESMDAAHETEHRPTIEQLQANLVIDEALIDNVKPIIVLFDDVLTTGAHFIACRNALQAKFPNARIVGVFVARRAFAVPVPDADGWVEVR